MKIEIQGANEHNLKDIDVTVGDGLTVVTGVSGSGKTSLVFDTLYHEARRRFLEIFSLGMRLAPADVRQISGLGPAVAVEQNVLNRNPGSTLATASGLHPFLRLLFARFGTRHCAVCDAPLTTLTEDEIVEAVMRTAAQSPVRLYAPLVQQTPGSHRTLLELLSRDLGALGLRVDGAAWHGTALDPLRPHSIEVSAGEVDAATSLSQVRATIEAAWALGANAIALYDAQGCHTVTLSRAAICVQCGAWFADLTPVHFHTPCMQCGGRGCEHCNGTGLHPEAAAVRWQGLRLPELLKLSVTEALARFAQASFPSTAGRLRVEIERRLDALERVGLGYIALDRSSPTLSRGESQRVRLALALTSTLEDMLHVLDEPTIGQHPADVARLLPAFRELGGPVVFVEHDRVAAAGADHAIDVGPGAGAEGGRVLFSGAPSELWKADTPTGRYFSLRERVRGPDPRPAPVGFLTVRGAALRNLQDIDIPLPLERFTVITGVSGSGKSTFVEDVLAASLTARKALGCRAVDGPWLDTVVVDQSPIGNNPRSNPATYTKLADIIRDGFAAATGLSPSRFSFNRPEGACPACSGIGAVEVQMRFLPSTWIPCEACDGQRFTDEVLAATVAFGERRLSIADLYRLPVCEIAPLVMNSPHLSESKRRAAGAMLQALCDIGLGYLPLGQPSPTLSGGEAQRVKLAKFLGKRSLAGRMLIMDEPSTGLHPQDIAGLLIVMDRLVRSGATIVVVEHNTDIIRAADWVVDLGPGAGPCGGQLLYAGAPQGLLRVPGSLTAQALRDEESVQPRAAGQSTAAAGTPSIAIRGARAHNLKGVDVEIPKGRMTVVTGVSGSGKSSLVGDVLEAEARRRFLESLSLYERQGTHEGPEAPVDAVCGLGVAVTVEGGARGGFGQRNTVGRATELAHHLAVLLAFLGERTCPACGTPMERESPTRTLAEARRTGSWRCPTCRATFPAAAPRHFSPTIYAAACTTCHGLGTLREPRPEKLIIHPELPICGGAMHSPGFFPKGYLCKPMNGGYEAVQALAVHFGFDPETTPWSSMSPEAQHAFLFGYPEPLEVTHYSRNGSISTHRWTYPGFYGYVRDWDVGGTYTDTRVCPACHGARLRPEYASVTLAGETPQSLNALPLARLAERVERLDIHTTGSHHLDDLVSAGLQTIRRRLRFLKQVGLGYLHLDRDTATLSAGEAQRIRLAGLLGSGLTSLTILVDEPSRGMHPSEVSALIQALHSLRDEGNTVIVVEHEPDIIRAADYLVDVGPGAGVAGGEIVARGHPDEVMKAQTCTAQWLRGERRTVIPGMRPQPTQWLVIRGARANNLRNEEIRLPLGMLVGICGVSGSGKSTLLIDTLGRALAPRKYSTSVAYEPIEPGEHDGIDGAPARTILIDQAKAGVTNPADFLGLSQPLHALFAGSEDALALGLDVKALTRRCSVCGGRGSITLDMGFLPDVHSVCEACRGTGFLPEAWEVRLDGLALPDVFGLTLDEVYARFGSDPRLAPALEAARDVGLGYLVLRQPGYALSGGEAQRLKIAHELSRTALPQTLYILDEPTVGQHLEDVARLAGVLHRLVAAGHSVFVVEHHTHLLATCDWLLELGPGGGPDGGYCIASGPPEALAQGATPTAPYLRRVLEGGL